PEASPSVRRIMCSAGRAKGKPLGRRHECGSERAVSRSRLFNLLNCDRLRRELVARLRHADETECADMGEPAFGVEPDLASKIAPFLAEAEVLADVGFCFRIDLTFKERVIFFALRIAERVDVPVARLRLVRD